MAGLLAVLAQLARGVAVPVEDRLRLFKDVIAGDYAARQEAERLKPPANITGPRG